MADDFHTLGDWSETGTYCAAIILPRDALGRICLQFRDNFPHVIAGGKWGYFGGEIENGETPAQAALRELHEETTIRMQDRDLTPFVRLLSNTKLNARHYVFLLEQTIEPSQISLKEGAGFAFFTKNQIADLDMVPATRRVVEHYFSTRLS